MEFFIRFDDKVVALVHAKRNQDSVATTDKLRQNRGLGAMANIYGM